MFRTGRAGLLDRAISTLRPRLFRSNGPSQHVVVARTIAEIDDKKSASSSTAVRKGKESIAPCAIRARGGTEVNIRIKMEEHERIKDKGVGNNKKRSAFRFSFVNLLLPSECTLVAVGLPKRNSAIC